MDQRCLQSQGRHVYRRLCARRDEMMCPKSKYDFDHPNTLFQVQNQNPNESFDLNDDDCYNSLLSEIEKCTVGGESAYSGWRFRWVSFPRI
jgi:hypothetical protein